MNVLDATVLIDYLSGDPDTEAYYEANSADEKLRVIPAPAYAEALAGVGGHPAGDSDRAIEALSWGNVSDTDGNLSVETTRIVSEIWTQRPSLDVVDALYGRYWTGAKCASGIGRWRPR